MKKSLGYILIILSILIQILLLIITPKLIQQKYPDSTILILSLLSIFFYFLAFIYRLGKKLSQKDIKLYLKHDSRDIVLWLRSCKHDNLKISSPKSSFSFFSLESHFKNIFGATYEEEITKELVKLGPVIAIDTKDKKTLGAIRDIVNDTNWKKVVIEKAKKSKLITILLNNSESLFWEINELPKYTNKNKFFYLLPSYTIHEKIDFKKSWIEIQQKVSLFRDYSYDDLKQKKIIGFYYEDNTLKELKVKKITDKNYINEIATILSTKMTKRDIEIENTKNYSNKSRIYGVRFFIFMIYSKLFDYDSIIVHIDQLVIRYILPFIAWIFFFMSIFYSYKTFKAPKEIKKMFKGNIFVGMIINLLIIFFIFIVPLLVISNIQKERQEWQNKMQYEKSIQDKLLYKDKKGTPSPEFHSSKDDFNIETIYYNYNCKKIENFDFQLNLKRIEVTSIKSSYKNFFKVNAPNILSYYESEVSEEKDLNATFDKICERTLKEFSKNKGLEKMKTMTLNMK